MTEPQDSTTPEPTVERVQVTHLPGRYGGRITHPWRWELTAPDGEIRYFDTKREALAWWDENKPTDQVRYLTFDDITDRSWERLARLQAVRDVVLPTLPRRVVAR